MPSFACRIPAVQICIYASALSWGLLTLMCLWPPVSTLLPRRETERGWAIEWGAFMPVPRRRVRVRRPGRHHGGAGGQASQAPGFGPQAVSGGVPASSKGDLLHAEKRGRSLELGGRGRAGTRASFEQHPGAGSWLGAAWSTGVQSVQPPSPQGGRPQLPSQEMHDPQPPSSAAASGGSAAEQGPCSPHPQQPAFVPLAPARSLATGGQGLPGLSRMGRTSSCIPAMDGPQGPSAAEASTDDELPDPQAPLPPALPLVPLHTARSLRQNGATGLSRLARTCSCPVNDHALQIMHVAADANVPLPASSAGQAGVDLVHGSATVPHASQSLAARASVLLSVLPDGSINCNQAAGLDELSEAAGFELSEAAGLDPSKGHTEFNAVEATSSVTGKGAASPLAAAGADDSTPDALPPLTTYTGAGGGVTDGGDDMGRVSTGGGVTTGRDDMGRYNVGCVGMPRRVLRARSSRRDLMILVHPERGASFDGVGAEPDEWHREEYVGFSGVRQPSGLQPAAGGMTRAAGGRSSLEVARAPGTIDAPHAPLVAGQVLLTEGQAGASVCDNAGPGSGGLGSGRDGGGGVSSGGDSSWRAVAAGASAAAGAGEVAGGAEEPGRGSLALEQPPSLQQLWHWVISGHGRRESVDHGGAAAAHHDYAGNGGSSPSVAAHNILLRQQASVGSGAVESPGSVTVPPFPPAHAHHPHVHDPHQPAAAASHSPLVHLAHHNLARHRSVAASELAGSEYTYWEGGGALGRCSVATGTTCTFEGSWLDGFMPEVPGDPLQHSIASRPNFGRRRDPASSYMFWGVNAFLVAVLVVGSVLDTRLRGGGVQQV